jgi:DNA-binding NtrC family response regulator
MGDTKRKILIVDDETTICNLLKEELTWEGYECVVAGNAEEALARLSESNFDAALLDIRLPDMSGMELLKQITNSYPGITPMMLTAVNDLNIAVEAMKAGAADYITKPFDLDRLGKALQSVLTKTNQPENETQDSTINSIESIALGVEARQEMLDAHSEKVIQQTAVIARQMNFTEEKIQEWISIRSDENSRKIKPFTDSISKLAMNPTPQDTIPK